MATLGRLEFIVQDTAGNAISGASVEVRRQGAQVSGAQAASPYTVDHVNGIVAADLVALNTGSTTRTVSSITATTVTTSGGDLGAVVDDDRITVASALPTLYEDAESATTKPNPLTTDATGTAWCYVTGGLYDVKVSGGGATTTLYVDQLAQGGTSTRINLFPSGSSVAYIIDTLRALAAGDTIVALRSAGANIFRVMGDGEIIAGATGATHALTGTLSLVDAVSRIIPGVTSLALRNNANSADNVLVSDAGAVTVRAGLTVSAGISALQAVTTVGITNTGAISTTTDLTARRLLADNGTLLTTADIALSAGWGTTATKAVYTDSTDTAGGFSVTANGAEIAANPNIVFTYKDGAFAAFPFSVPIRGDAAAPAGGYWRTFGSTKTITTFEFVGLPVAGNTYILFYNMLG